MCGRYYYDDYMWADLLQDFPELAEADIEGLPAARGEEAGIARGSGMAPGRTRRDIVPSVKALALTAERDAAVRARQLAWGFPDREGKRLIINARAEGIGGKPTFADSIRTRRCVLPAAGFYEWDRSRQKVSFSLPERPILYLAGIRRPYEDADGVGERFVIITREANESMRPVHDRMPLMIAREDVRAWLTEADRTEEFLAQTLPQLAAEREYEQTTLF